MFDPDECPKALGVEPIQSSEKDEIVKYKPEQGRAARLVTFWLLWLLLVYGYVEFKIFLDNRTFLPEMMQKSFGVLPGIAELTPNAIFAYIVLPALTAFLLIQQLNRPKIADFLIEMESELRKVHWPTGKETRTAALVVMTCVLILGVYLYGVDRALGLVVAGILDLSPK